MDCPLSNSCAWRKRYGTTLRSCAPFLVLILVGLAWTSPTEAQVTRPGDQRLDLPNFLPPASERAGQLPEIPLPPKSDREGLLGGVRFELKEVRVEGNTALDDDELEEIVAPHVGRVVSYADLQQLRHALTLAYVDRGYVTSGAVLPGQTIEDGVVVFQIVEGRLARIEIETDGRFRKRYLRSRVSPRISTPVNVADIEQSLQLLLQDRRIDRIEATLSPGAERGEAILSLSIYEHPPYEVHAEVNNHQPPAIGAEGGSLEAAWTNISGWGDAIRLGYHGTEGVQSVDARYAIPVTADDLTIEAHYLGSWSEIVTEPFDVLDIENRTWTAGFTFAQPVYRTLQTDVTLTMTADYRYNKSFLFSNGFAFTPGPNDQGESKIAVLRFGQDFFYRGQAQAVSARSLLSVGVDFLGATSNGGGTPDGEFFSWLAQVQWAGLLTKSGVKLIARADLQLSDRALLGLEQFGLGGHATVRGYRENEFVRDQGFVAGVEARIPVWWDSIGDPIVEVAPFVDAGRSWNKKKRGSGFGEGDNSENLVGIGLGVRWAITEWSAFQLYWGRHLLSRSDQDEWNLQDTSLYFRLQADWPWH